MSHAPSHHRLPAALLLALTACLAMASSAGAQATGTSTSDLPGGKATRLAWAVDGLVPPVAARIPTSLVVAAPGFRLDRRAVAKRCKQGQAELNECPANSRIGTGVLTIIVHRPAGVNEIPFAITLYHGPKENVLAVTEFIGVRVVPGTLTRTDGRIELTFDPLPTPPVIPGVQLTYQFKGVSVDLGVSRKVVSRRKGGKRRTIRRSLVRTPDECPGGAWAATATLAFPDATNALLNTPMACRAP